MRRPTACLLVSLSALGLLATTAHADGTPRVDTTALARVAGVGSLLGPDASRDALYLLGVTNDQLTALDAAAQTGSGGHDEVAHVPSDLPAEYRESPPTHPAPAASVTARPTDTSGFTMSTDAPVPGRGGVYGGPVDPGGAGLRPADVVPRPGQSHAPRAVRVTVTSTDAGSITCPVAGKTWFTDTWAAARSGGRRHQGTDMFAKTGTPVVAVADAVVTRIDRVDTSGPTGAGDLGGISVSYVTARGDRWYNSHLSAVASGLEVGDHVRAGQPVAAVGNTGNAKPTPPHLHVEWHPGDGEAVPNYAPLRTACG